ncbi:LPXTG cell wall anchor domain-containing protein [Enterococcus sp.]|uniref:LPXTG cell wall anchor domain-containing protein n=1 Tax=Enterococcus sp. TaxID=35783 RepID=UPI002908518A|nr:LPXTG cell wall anchor domain-containing protein [Enterococcus sp.]MDU5334995.1 LPXTG cell wall anchor domain-containing protein [Enterococcus sp.]
MSSYLSQEIQTAIVNLKTIKRTERTVPTSVNNPPTSTRKVYPTATASAKSYPRTGMLAGSGLMIAGFAAVGAALTSWKKRKEK